MFDSEIKIYSNEELQKFSISELHSDIFPKGYKEIETWSQKRQIEFLLARKSVKDLCFKNDIVLKDDDLKRREDRQCIWPKGIIGSISHSRNALTNELSIYVAISNEHNCIGVDVEQINRFEKHDIKKTVIDKTEEKILNETHIKSVHPQLKYGLIFSAKESLFKALYPTCNTYFSFHDASLVDIVELKDEISVTLSLKIKLKNIDQKIYNSSLKFINTNYISSIIKY